MYRNLYDAPLLYDRLRPPDPEDVRTALSLLGSHSARRVETIIDPACGPGSLLLAFAKLGYNVVGNDSSPEMCTVARKRLAGYICQITRGNMTSLPFVQSSVDAAVEISGVACELSHAEFMNHMNSIFTLLRPGGIYILCLLDIDERCLAKLPARSWHSRVETAEHIETIEYFIETYNPEIRCVQMRREAHTDDRLRTRDYYPLHMYDQALLRTICNSFPEVSLVATINQGQDDIQHAFIRETLHVFRKYGHD